MTTSYKILLINPPHIQEKGLFPRIVFEPLGLAYVGAYLEQEGYDVSIVDAIGLGFDRKTEFDHEREIIGLPYDEIEAEIRKYKPDLVGIGVPFTMRAESAFKVASLVKAVDSKIPTVLGGIHVSSYPEDSIENKAVDYIVMGEGELPMAALVKAIRGGSIEEIRAVLGVGYLKNGKSVFNPRQPLVDDLDLLAHPARHLLPMDRYFEASKLFMTGRHGKKFGCIITSRGCPYKYITFIHIEDDNMTLSKDRVARICDRDLIIERGLKIKWDTPNGIMAHTIADEEVLRKMKASGCQYICVAPESGNQHVIDNVIHKKIPLDKIVDVVKICKKIGLKVDAFFVIGFVGETQEQIHDTIRFAKELRGYGASRCHFHIATPFEGTEMYDEAKEKGYLVDAPDGCIKMETKRLATPDFTVRDIDRLFMEGSKVNPAIPFDKIGIVWHLLLNDPLKLMRSSFNYFTKRLGGLSS